MNKHMGMSKVNEQLLHLFRHCTGMLCIFRACLYIPIDLFKANTCTCMSSFYQNLNSLFNNINLTLNLHNISLKFINEFRKDPLHPNIHFLFGHVGSFALNKFM